MFLIGLSSPVDYSVIRAELYFASQEVIQFMIQRFVTKGH